MRNGAISIFRTLESFRGEHGQETLPESEITGIQGNWMSSLLFRLSLRRSFDSISLKLDRLVGTIRNWSRIVSGPNRPIRGRGAGGHANARTFGKWKPGHRFFLNSIHCYEKWSYWNFWLNRCLTRANLVYSNKHGTPKACLSGNHQSLYFQHLVLQDLWNPSMIIVLKESRSVFLRY